MGRVLVVTGGYFVEHAAKDLGIVRELKRRGHTVNHVVVAQDIPPAFPRPVVEQTPEFQEAGSRWVNRLSDLLPYIPASDVVLIPVHKGVGPACDWAHRLGKVVVQHQNHGGFDYYHFGADLIGVKGPYFADFVRQHWSLAEDTVVSTGCVQYDPVVRPEHKHFPREEFCRLYGLDPNKRIAVWLPTREDRQHQYYDWSLAKYREICEIVSRSSNHNLIIKPHPADYSDPRFARDAGPRWVDTVFPGAAVCRVEHAFACFHVCDVGLANWSASGLEYALFRRPFLYVDVADNPRVQYLKQTPNPDQPIGFHLGTLVPGFVGQVCTSAELPNILETCSYEVTDESLYDDHIARFLTSADGRAYERVADLVERGLALYAARPGQPARGQVARLRFQIWAQEVRRRLSALRRASPAEGGAAERP